MCKTINFSEYGRTKATGRTKQLRKRTAEKRKIEGQELVTAKWLEEYRRNGWGLSKLIAHIIEQYGYICCEGGKKYAFEDAKRDVKYYEMCPEIKEKHFKAPLWVKVNGEWYFVEVYTDYTSQCTVNAKWTEVGNHNVKGFFVDLYGLNKRKIKGMLERNDVMGVVKEICSYYEERRHSVMGDTECKALVAFGGEKSQRECIYKLVEFDLYEYAVLEGTEVETGNKHLVLLAGTRKPKEYAEHFRKKYRDAGIPLLYGKWKPYMENWKSCISKQRKLYKRLVMVD